MTQLELRKRYLKTKNWALRDLIEVRDLGMLQVSFNVWRHFPKQIVAHPAYLCSLCAILE